MPKRLPTSTSDRVEGALLQGGQRSLHTPHLITTVDQLHDAVDDLSTEDAFVLDVETTKQRPKINSLLWVGLGAAGRVHLIPCGHPLGRLIQGEHKEKEPAWKHFGADDERGKTKLGKPSNRMVEFTVKASYGEPVKQLDPGTVTSVIRPLLWSDRGIIGHNLKYDLQSLIKYYDEIPPGPYHDTILLEHSLNETLDSYDLKSLTRDWLYPRGVDSKKWAKFYPNLGEKGVEDFGIDEVARYLAKDLRFCWLRFKAKYPRLARRGVQSVYDFEMSLYRTVMAMEYEGFPLDTSKQQAVREELEKRIKEVNEEAWGIAGGEFPMSNLEYKRYVLFGEFYHDKRDLQRAYAPGEKKQLATLKLKALVRTKETQRASVSQAVLEHYASRGVRMAELLLEWSALEKLRGTFIEGLGRFLIYGDGEFPTVHTSFKQHGTVTGRFSSAEPNLQQIPKRSAIKDMFVAGRGHTLICADYDQIELRCAGYLCQDPNMVRVFKEGQDIHRRAAASMYQVGLDEVTPFQRDVGKTQNFGTLYGAGEEKIASVAGVSKRTAANFIRNYYEEFAALEPWKEIELQQARERGDEADPLVRPPYVIIPPNGRRRRLPELYQRVERWQRLRAERQAINALVQGFAANIMKLAMRTLYPELGNYPAQMLAQVHDEIVVRSANEAADDVRQLVSSVLSGVLDDHGLPILGEIPLVVSVGVGDTWATAKG